MGVAVFGVAGFALMGIQPAEAGCQLVKATASSTSKAQAAKDSQALAVQSAHEVKRARGWSYISMSARRVKGDPFWKAVRPAGVPADALLKPDIVTGRFYTTCFTGVVVPIVCTTGSAVCGN
jgi:D-arabinose 1-dehydrogenase-like Zn-dependent alcohol dehydrogenase